LLKEHHITETYDSIENKPAIVKNPVWLIDRHTKWVHRKTFTIGRFPSIAFNSQSGILYAIDHRNLFVYDPAKDAIDKKIFQGHPVHSDANQLLYVDDQLLNYDVFTNKLLSYNFQNNSWNNNDTSYNEPNYWHNNKFYNPVDKSLYTFGGYGHFTYKSGFLRYDPVAKKWDKVNSSDSIPPRYLAAAGLYPSKQQALLFGGYGSVSGKQELSPQSFYDLYSFDLKSHEINKLVEFSPGHVTEDMVFSNSLIVDESNNCFYVLSYPKNKYQSTVKLRQYSLDQPETKILGDSIPFHFHDVHSFCDLFLSEATKELIAVTVHKEKEQFQVEVYSINYPPLQTTDVIQSTESTANTNIVAIALIGALVLCGGLAFVYLRKKKAPVVSSTLETAAVPIATRHTPHTLHHEEESKLTSSLLLFGGFQVFDKSGADISGKFTMTLRELFALVLLHSIKFEKGISTTELQEFLWPDKDEVSARNNRNVNIKKLRSLLEEIGDITLENNNSYLHLSMNENIFCDYQTVFRILNHERSPVHPERERVDVILKNVKRGSLLPNLQTSWLDNFKSDISNQIIDTLLEFSQTLDAHKDDKLLLEIADAVFNYDSINQEALVIKCSVLNKRGKYSLAKTWYDHFVKEYKNLYSENYPKTFEEVISQVPAS
jgi:two-component SAPR family response regulator